MSLFSWLTEGGAFMYLILGVSIVALALIGDRVASLYFTFTWDEDYFKKVLSIVRNGDLNTAQRICRETSHPLANAMAALLRAKASSSENLDSEAQICWQKLAPQVTRHTAYLQMFANIATLLGLLGTIQGLTVAFSSLAGASGAEKAALLANGISTAMNTTAFGLVVAIPCIVAFTIISGKENSRLEKYEATLDETVLLIKNSMGEIWLQQQVVAMDDSETVQLSRPVVGSAI